MRILYLPNSYSQQRNKDVKANIYPVLMAMEAEYYRKQGWDVVWVQPKDQWQHVGALTSFHKVITEPEGLPFLDLPAPDRIFTKATEYTSGNYKYLPATHLQAARDCWYHSCAFCSWAKKYPVCETRSVESVIAEIKQCVELGFREIFDDSGTFPVGDWLKSFCQSMIDTGLNKQVTLGCNMRFGALDLEDFDLMTRAGFRMILWGLESVNQSTLDKLNKGVRINSVLPELYAAKAAGLHSHLAIMTGYPWETFEEQKNTYEFVERCLLKNIIKTAQATIYDVGEGATSPFGIYFRNKLYAIYHNPRYLWHRIKEIRNFDDVEYLLRGGKKLWARK